MKMTVFWDIAAVALMMQTARTSETSADFYKTTRRNIPEDSRLHIFKTFVNYCFRVLPLSD
jgi:hypothetical protein